MAPIPQTLGRYEIQEALGQGGMGILYLARDPWIDRLVALKVLRDDDEDLRQRFSREARVIGRLQHLNIVAVHDVGEHEGQPFIAMEYVPGETLAQKIAAQDPLPLDRRLQLMQDLCGGLAYAHQHDVVHRDVKPANLIMHRDTGQLKILDFGIARLTTGTGLTQYGARIGTPRYMAPEQLAGRPVDYRCDVFAVGLVLYELLTYQAAFSGDDPEELARRILDSAPPSLGDVDVRVDPTLITIVDRALQKDAARRYQDLTEMGEALGRVRQGLDTETRMSTVRPRPSASDAGATPRLQMDREAVLRRRQGQLQAHLDSAQAALSGRNYARALEATEQAALLSPDDSRVHDLLEALQLAQDTDQIGIWLTEAREHLVQDDPTPALELVDQVLQLRPDHPDAQTLQREGQRALAVQQAAEERVRAIDHSLDQARTSVDVDVALDAVRAVLADYPDHAEAQTLEQQILQAIAARDRRAAEDRQAQDVVESARRDFEAGRHDTAIRRLEAHPSDHSLVKQALADLRAAEEAHRRTRDQHRVARIGEIRAALTAQRFDDGVRGAATLRDDGFDDDEVGALQREAEAGIAAAEATAALAARVQAYTTRAAAALSDDDLAQAQSEVAAALALDPTDGRALELRVQIARAIRSQAPTVAATPPRVERTQSAAPASADAEAPRGIARARLLTSPLTLVSLAVLVALAVGAWVVMGGLRSNGQPPPASTPVAVPAPTEPLDPTPPDNQNELAALLERGNVARTETRYTDAVEAYQAALLLQPDHADARARLDDVNALIAQQAQTAAETARLVNDGNDLAADTAAANKEVPNQPTSAPASDSSLELRVELALWEAIAESQNRAAFEDYLRRYPTGRFRAAAVARLAELPPPDDSSDAATAAAAAQATVEQRLWDLVQGSPNRANLEEYLRLFPDGRFREEAEASLAVLDSPGYAGAAAGRAAAQRELLLTQGKFFLERGEYGAARRAFQEVLATEPRNALAIVGLSDTDAADLSSGALIQRFEDVRHDHAFGGCRGVLVVRRGRVEFNSDEDSFTLDGGDLERVYVPVDNSNDPDIVFILNDGDRILFDSPWDRSGNGRTNTTELLDRAFSGWPFYK